MGPDYYAPCMATPLSQHEFACIPMAAFHINTSSVRVRFALVRVVSVRALFQATV